MSQKDIDNNTSLPEYIRPKDIKEYYKIGNKKVQNLLERRDFPSYKIGRNWYIDKNKFIEWASKQPMKPNKGK